MILFYIIIYQFIGFSLFSFYSCCASVYHSDLPLEKKSAPLQGMCMCICIYWLYVYQRFGMLIFNEITERGFLHKIEND